MISANDCRQQYLASVNAAILLSDLAEQESNEQKVNLRRQSLLQGALFHLGQGLKNLCLAYAQDELRTSLANELDLQFCLEKLRRLPVCPTELALLLKSLQAAGLDHFTSLYQHLFETPQSFTFSASTKKTDTTIIAVDVSNDRDAFSLDVETCRYWVEEFAKGNELVISLSVEC